MARLPVLNPLVDHAARADLMRRFGRTDAAAASYRAALELPGNDIENRYLERRLREVG